MFAFVTQSAAIATKDGIPVSVCEGDVWDASDPIVKAHPNLFADEPAEVKRSVPKAPAKKPVARKGAKEA